MALIEVFAVWGDDDPSIHTPIIPDPFNSGEDLSSAVSYLGTSRV